MIALGSAVAVSALLWLVVYYRIRRLEKVIVPLDAEPLLDAPPDGWPRLSVIVPARNEERDVGACLTSLAAQDYPCWELIFVDDESTDRTLEQARQALAGGPPSRVLAGRPRPAGSWVGKNWALVQGAAEARGDWLLFIDAAIVHHPAALRQGVALARQLNVDALSIMPAIECHSRWERVIMPLFALLSALVAPADRANQPGLQGSRLAGAFILVRRAAYEAVGGHGAIANQILEDMALARRLKHQGFSIWLTYTHDLTRTRMYDTFNDLWAGLTRLSFPMMNYRPALLLAAWLAAFFGTLVPWLALAGGLTAALLGHPGGLGTALAGLAVCACSPRIMRKVFRLLNVSRLYAWLLPLAAHVYCLAATWSALRHYSGRGVGWKQRVYRRGAS